MPAVNRLLVGKYYKRTPIRPSVGETIKQVAARNVTEFPYKGPFDIPADAELWKQKAFTRFHTGRTLRRQGKERIYRKLSSMPPVEVQFDHNGDVSPVIAAPVPQTPTVFPELAGFDQQDVSVQNTSTTPAVSRGLWGELSNILTTAGEFYTTLTKSKYEAQIAESQAKIAAAQAAKTQPTIVQTITKSSYTVPLLIAAAGIGAIVLLSKKKRR